MSREAYRATPGAGATFLEVEIILGFKHGGLYTWSKWRKTTTFEAILSENHHPRLKWQKPPYIEYQSLVVEDCWELSMINLGLLRVVDDQTWVIDDQSLVVEGCWELWMINLGFLRIVYDQALVIDVQSLVAEGCRQSICGCRELTRVKFVKKKLIASKIH